MRPRNRPKSNSTSGLTPTAGGPAGDRPEPAPAGRATELAGSSRPAIRRVFASSTPAAAEASLGGLGGPGGDVDELVVRLPLAGLGAGCHVAPSAAAEPVGTSPDVAPEILAATAAGNLGQRVEVLAAAERGRTTFTPTPVDLVAAGG